MIEPTQEQKLIAGSDSPLLLVRALAGTGKTYTVALRAQMLASHGMTAVLTFTRSARDEIHSRLKSDTIEVSTVHGLAYKIVKERLGTDLMITDGSSEIAYALAQYGLPNSLGAVEIVRRAGVAQWNGQPSIVQNLSHDAERLLSILALYRQKKRDNRVLDFDDLVVLAASLGTNRFENLIVDEAQDSSAVQMKFIQRLASKSLTLVGDPNQVVFEFAGVDEQVLNVEDSWERLSLTESFRSSMEVLRPANQLLDQGQIFSRVASGEVNIFDCDLVPGLSAPDVILARTKSELAPFKKSFEAEGFKVGCSWDETVTECDIFLSTVHASKGREWDHVAVVNIDENGFRGFEPCPSEKRLFYVATTRAKRRLDFFVMEGLLPWGVKL